MTQPLEQVLADWRENAAVLRRTGHTHHADLVENVVDEVAAAAEDYVRWLTEEDAMLRSGRARAWLRSRWPTWAEQGHAMHDQKGRRVYRMIIVPQRANLSAALEDARQTARRSTAV